MGVKNETNSSFAGFVCVGRGFDRLRQHDQVGGVIRVSPSDQRNSGILSAFSRWQGKRNSG